MESHFVQEFADSHYIQLGMVIEQLIQVPAEVRRIEGELIQRVQKVELVQVSQFGMWLMHGSHKSELALNISEVFAQPRQKFEELQ